MCAHPIRGSGIVEAEQSRAQECAGRRMRCPERHTVEGCGAIRRMKTMGDLNVLLRQPALPPKSAECVCE